MSTQSINTITNPVDCLLKKMQQDDAKLTADMFVCVDYKTEEDNIKENLGLNDYAWKYFDFDQMLLDDWKYGSNRDCIDNTYIVMEIDNKFILLEEISKEFPIWKNRIEEFFKGNINSNIYIIRRT